MHIKKRYEPYIYNYTYTVCFLRKMSRSLTEWPVAMAALRPLSGQGSGPTYYYTLGYIILNEVLIAAEYEFAVAAHPRTPCWLDIPRNMQSVVFLSLQSQPRAPPGLPISYAGLEKDRNGRWKHPLSCLGGAILSIGAKKVTRLRFVVGNR